MAGLPGDNRGSRLKLLELGLDAKGRIINHRSSTEIICPESCPTDKEIDDVLTQFKSQVMAAYKEKVGELINPLLKGWKEESTLGDLVTDGMRGATGAEIGLINSGAIQDDLATGEVTLKDVFRAVPFDNNVLMIKATGAEIRESIESQLRLNYTHQVSGLSYRARDDADGNTHLIDLNVGGKPIEASRTYTVAVTDFALSRLDRLRSRKGEVKGSVRAILIAMLRKHSPLARHLEARVTIERAAQKR
ncbi:MAG: 5'-nucleotidase C-terminal domain-containing protein [Candidatus Riflebacteria bacterium]|nr:5'-nucleotidase C-terminal domain-containing protein [Candidatus Riflebacteria bacterium]